MYRTDYVTCSQRPYSFGPLQERPSASCLFARFPRPTADQRARPPKTHHRPGSLKVGTDFGGISPAVIKQKLIYPNRAIKNIIRNEAKKRTMNNNKASSTGQPSEHSSRSILLRGTLSMRFPFHGLEYPDAAKTDRVVIHSSRHGLHRPVPVFTYKQEGLHQQ